MSTTLESSSHLVNYFLIIFQFELTILLDYESHLWDEFFYPVQHWGLVNGAIAGKHRHWSPVSLVHFSATATQASQAYSDYISAIVVIGFRRC